MTVIVGSEPQAVINEAIAAPPVAPSVGIAVLDPASGVAVEAVASADPVPVVAVSDVPPDAIVSDDAVPVVDASGMVPAVDVSDDPLPVVDVAVSAAPPVAVVPLEALPSDPVPVGLIAIIACIWASESSAMKSPQVIVDGSMPVCASTGSAKVLAKPAMASALKEVFMVNLLTRV